MTIVNWLDTVLKYKWTSLCTDTIAITNIIFKPQEETEHKNKFLLSSKYSAHVTSELRQPDPETHTKPNAWSVSEEKEKDWLLTLPHLVRSSMSTSMESCSMCRSSRSISKWTSSSFRPETSIITIISLLFHNTYKLSQLLWPFKPHSCGILELGIPVYLLAWGSSDQSLQCQSPHRRNVGM